MERDQWQRISADARESRDVRLRRRQRWYFSMMAVCLSLFVSGIFVAQWSKTVAVSMFAVAAVIPPVAALVANWGEDR